MKILPISFLFDHKNADPENGLNTEPFNDCVSVTAIDDSI